MKLFKYVLPAMLLTFALDMQSKWWAERHLEHYISVPVIGGFLQFTLTHNFGLAMGWFTTGGVWPFLISGITLVLLFSCFAYLAVVRALPRTTAWLVGMFLGGSIANFSDRWYDKSVIDFVDVGLNLERRFIFNLADLCIVISLCFLLRTRWFGLLAATDQTEGKVP
jgi:signal peptidase II